VSRACQSGEASATGRALLVLVALHCWAVAAPAADGAVPQGAAAVQATGGPPSDAGRPVFPPVRFDTGRGSVKPEYLPLLGNVARWMRETAGSRVLLVGHADERGTAEYSIAVGELRARAVRRVLLGLGIPPERIDTVSHGAESPVAPGHDEAAWEKNRRVEIRLSVP